MFQKFEKFPSANYEILEPIFQNDSHINYRAYNRVEGVFFILKYVFLKKSSPEASSFFSYLESISNLNRNLFLYNYHVYQDESLEGLNEDPDDLTLVLSMQHNVASLKQILDGRISKNEPYNQPELTYILLEFIIGIMNIQPGMDTNINANYHNQAIIASKFLCFNLEAFMVVPNKIIDIENQDKEPQKNYSYKISNFDSVGQVSLDLSEEDVVRNLSSLILQLMGLEIDSYHLLEDFPLLGPLLQLMKRGETSLVEIQSSLEGMNRFPPNEDFFWPLDPEAPELTEIERVKTFETYTEAYYNLGFFNSALKPALLNLQYLKDKSPGSPEYAKAMNDVGVLYWKSGKLEQALELMIECLDLMKQLYASDHVILAVCYNNLAVIFEDIAEYNEALKYYKMAYELRINAESYDTLPVAMNNLACLYSRMNQEMGEAKVLFENSLEMKEGVNKPNSLGISLNNFAIFNSNSGDLDKAIELLEKAKSLTEKFHNETYLIILNNLGFSLAQKGFANEAMELYENAKLIINDQYRVHSGVSVQILSNYGYLLFQIGKFQNAISVLEKALRMKEKINGGDNLNYGIIANNLGESYLKMERFDDAVTILERSLEIRSPHYDPKDKKIALSWNNLGMAYLKMKDFDNAFRCFNNTVEIDPNNVAGLNNLGLLYSINEQYPTAIEQYDKAYQSISASKGINCEETMKIASNMAALYVKLKNFEKAEDYLRTSLTIAEETFPDKVDFIVKTKERIENLIRVKETDEKAFLPNSIKTLISMKREKEEALTNSLLLNPNENNVEDYLEQTLYSQAAEINFPNLDQAKSLLKDVNETLLNLKTWKKSEKLDFEKQIRENEQKVILLNHNRQEYEENLEKYMTEMEELKIDCSNQIEKISQKFNHEEIGCVLKEYEDSFKKIMETNQKLETLINKHQSLSGQCDFGNDVQHQFYKTAIESLNFEKLNKSLGKWQDNIEEFYHKTEENKYGEKLNLGDMKMIKLEELKVQEKAIEDSEISNKIKLEMDEIDKELEELERILA